MASTTAPNTSDPANLLTKTVKTQNIASKPELNGQLGTVLSYIPHQDRYIIQLQPTQVGPQHTRPRTISLKHTNLTPANYLDRALSAVSTAKLTASSIYHDPQTRLHLRDAYDVAHRGLTQRGIPPRVRPEHAAGLLLLLLFGAVRVLGFATVVFIGSAVGILGTVALPDVMAGSGVRVIARNFPGRWREMVVEGTGFGWITERMAMAVLVLFLFLSGRGLVASGAKDYSRAPVAPAGGLGIGAQGDGGSPSEGMARWTLEEVYKMGFDDSTQEKDYTSSLPVDHASMGYFVPQSQSATSSLSSIDEGFDLNNYQPSSPPPAQKKGGFGISTAVTLFAIGRTVKDLGFTPEGRFEFPLLVSNVKAMEKWKLGFMGLAIYRLVSAFL